MACLATEAEIQLATWLAGQPGMKYGVCITKSRLVIKYAPAAQASHEPAAIRFIRRQCPDIPVPEVLGTWEAADASGDKIGYIAMSELRGSTLRDAWPMMSKDDQVSILEDLRAILAQLRRIEVPKDAMIGALAGGTGVAADVRAGGTEYGGPFHTESDFNEWLISLVDPDLRELFGSFYIDTIRNSLTTFMHRLRFAHGDLGMHNILVEGGRITGIVDWEYAGWYPEHWEHVKMTQFSREKQFLNWCRECWEIDGLKVLYDVEYIVDQMLSSQARHGERVIRRPR